MPPKRKHQASTKDSNATESPYSKRPRRSGTSSNQQPDLAQTLYDMVREYRDENNHVVSDSFVKLPSKRYHADYYERIVDPVDLNKIAHRIKLDEYKDIEILTTDIQLMISNAKKYYDDETQEYKDACTLWEVYLSAKDKLTEESTPTEPAKGKPGRKPKSRTKAAVESQESDREEIEITQDDLKDLYENVITETDENGRVIVDMFMKLPDKEQNAQYYKIIKDPIDLDAIGERLEEGKYKTIADMKKDITLLVKNARTFNDPHSQIYRDAISIKNNFRDRSEELEKSKRPGYTGPKLTPRSKSRKPNSNIGTPRGSERLHEKSIAKQETVDVKAELHEASITDPSEGDVQAIFYNEVVNYKNPLGHTISDPFVRLPNKRFYPMYYDDIENPISLKMIRKRIQAKKYENCEEMVEDFGLLFSNAKQFNIGTSQIHKDASTLQKFVESKLPEFMSKEEEELEYESESDEDQDNDSQNDEADEKVEGVEDGQTEDGTKNIVDGQEMVTPKKKRRHRKKSAKESLQNRLQLLYNILMEAEDENGRNMITLFLEKPSRKDYPDYYKLVLEPIDMKMIEKKIRHDKYFNVPDMLEDFNLMFNNARHYNEPGSQVYSDADQLEKLLLTKNGELEPLPEAELLERTPRTTKKVSDLEEKMEKFFCGVRDYIDPTNRMICEIFMHLPTKQMLPDYYKVIKKPIDMDRIQNRMQTAQYLKLDEMLADLLLMLENACQYNEPGSLIYKDALILQKVVMDKFYELEKVEEILSPENLVQEMLISLFMSVMSHQDDSGRCYSESFTSQQSNEGDENKTDKTQETKPEAAATQALTFEIIKKNLHNRRYRRLDVFQEHMFQVFEEARNKNRTDSEIYEDAIELQKFFIKIRDELCKNGETLLSPALSLTIKRLENEFEAERKEKLPEENIEDEKMNEDGKEFGDKTDSQNEGVSHKGTIYKPGDFVYVDNPENSSSPHIVNVVKLYKDENGQQMLYGFWLYRPEATFHMASKKFFVKEVFKSDYFNAVPITLVQGKCFVMLSRDYFKLKPVGFKEEDVYVAESRYSSKTKSFKRMKMPQWPHNPTELIPRDMPLPVIRISSCYSEQKQTDDTSAMEKMRTMLMQDIEESWPTDVIDVERKNIEAEGIVSGETKHYIQYCANGMWVKVGDCVYLRQENTNLPKIARIERLWVEGNGRIWFEGPWFKKPEDTEHEPTRTFYKNELFISCSETTFSFDYVIGKCVVLYVRDYFACRPTEMPEKDIFLFESKHISGENMIRKIKSAKRYAPSFKAVDDEYYYYKRPLASEMVVSPLLLKGVEGEIQNRKDEAIMMKTKQETEAAPSSAPAPTGYPQVSMPPHLQAYPPGVPVYPQTQMIPGQPYPHYAHHAVAQYPAAVIPQGPNLPVATPPHPYAQQPYVPARYPSPHPALPPQHASPYQPPPQVYPPSPQIAPPPPAVTPSSSMQSPEGSRPSSARPEAAPTPPTTTKRRGRSGHSTGYILFASHCHPKVRSEHPDMAFGEISKIVGEEWRNLAEDRKREFEEKAKVATAKAEAEGRLFKKRRRKKDVEEPVSSAPPTPSHASNTPQQFSPHPSAPYPGTPEQAYVGQRMPMPQQHPGAPQQYPVTSFVQTPVGPAYAPHVAPTPQAPAPPLTIPQQHRAKRGPLFVKPPPKAQRVMHSEAYLRYIEGLEKGSKSVSNWEKTLKATERDIKQTRQEELPVQWLGSGKGRHETATAALWALRNLMLKDALTIKNNFN